MVGKAKVSDSFKTTFFTMLTFLLTNMKTKDYIIIKFKLCIKKNLVYSMENKKNILER